MRVHFLSIFASEPVGGGRRVRYGGGTAPGRPGDSGRDSGVLSGSEGFEVRAPAGAAGSPGPGGPALCVVPAETPGGPLTPFERRVVAHVALRAGARGEVPAPALS